MVGGYPIPGVGVPQPGLDDGGYPIPEGYPGQVLMVGGTPSQVWGGGVPQPGLDGGMEYPPDLGWATPHHQDLAGVPPYPGMDTPPPDLGWGTPTIKTWLGYPPTLGWGTPPPQTWDGVPPSHSEHLLRGGWYASCVHAGGISYCSLILTCRLCTLKFLVQVNVIFEGKVSQLSP